MADREHTPQLDCGCLTWCREYGVGRPFERHHRDCPKWYEYLGTAYRTRTELIVTGHPGGDENHNCDAMGCSSVSHVLVRLPLASDPAAHVSGVTPAALPREPCVNCGGACERFCCTSGGPEAMTPEESYRATVAELQALARNAPHVTQADILEIASLPADELRRRAIRQRDWAGHWSHCLDGLGVWKLPGAAPDGCWMPREVRSVVEQLLQRNAGVNASEKGRTE